LRLINASIASLLCKTTNYRINHFGHSLSCLVDFEDLMGIIMMDEEKS